MSDKIMITREGYDRLRQVQDWLRAIEGSDDNNKFDMELWQCGSTCCIAGKAAALAGKTMYKTTFGQPSEVMRLNQAIGEQACGLPEGTGDTLFYVCEWPTDLRDDYDDACGERDHQIELGIMRIERFLTKEVEVVG